ncbi:antibiotic biosynthesis monooxygenase [Mesorhizobium sp. WSM4312]|uniref:putative quinol monooxygenase n=1 Tax=unclassified Mesorhizobium TaxID=325217 RepID=UPI000BB0AB0B|nr:MULTISPECIES: putative quinol monooxygenase [unclassified Mesorhizobium]PBB66655.1 antibiotic biosynthesis monooxygenase [Mesorhizobium sp. WSM4312]PBC21287.1 antibiotic biosynthesis monooxygenase [Mesorhizobium sp. WSM4311]TRD04785.1 antibiotic biosynthesis monooxygenase [Mesorhizobium sp. WSM4305]
MSTGVKIVGILTARPGKAAELRRLLSATRVSSRGEPGNLRWDIWHDRANSDRFILDELYLDDTALTAHRETPHFKEYARKIGDLAERTPIVLDPVEVT